MPRLGGTPGDGVPLASKRSSGEFQHEARAARFGKPDEPLEGRAVPSQGPILIQALLRESHAPAQLALRATAPFDEEGDQALQGLVIGQDDGKRRSLDCRRRAGQRAGPLSRRAGAMGEAVAGLGGSTPTRCSG